MRRLLIIIGAGTALTLAGCIPTDPSKQRPPPRPDGGETPQLPVDLLDLPETTPTWEMKPVIADARTIAAGRYTVVPGDTLRAIAERTGAGSEAIARVNGLAAPFVIRPGQVLVIPAGRYHRVRPGDTGISIARAYHVDWDRIIDLNALKDPYSLRTGMLLLLPPQAEVAAMTLEQRAAAFSIDIDDIVTGAEPAVAEDAPPPPRRAATAALPPSQPVIEPSTFSGRFDWPLSGGRILVPFGPAGGGRVNDGIKIAAVRGAPIKAAADGVVAYAGDEIAIYGGLILLKHGDGWVTAYGHAEKIAVQRGQKVKRGDVIGYAGETGSAREPQLHFEIRHNRSPVNPLKELPPR